MKIHFILVEPAVPENIGASCRAIKTMGFESLRVVKTKAHLEEKARWLAHGSGDVLENINHFNSLQEAIVDMDLVIGSTARKRTNHDEHIPSNEIVNFIKEKSSITDNVAIVFGSEESGLSSSDIELCHALTKIPIITTHPSLNLSQAVMLYAYELSVFNISKNENQNCEVDVIKIKPLLEMVDELATLININKSQKLYHQIKNRIVLLNKEDLHLVYSVCAKTLGKIKRIKK
ncbi:MAG: tRNA/rRNA methyltransferase [Bacteroidota bacterium]